MDDYGQKMVQLAQNVKDNTEEEQFHEWLCSLSDDFSSMDFISDSNTVDN